jgi:hypothetical protein
MEARYRVRSDLAAPLFIVVAFIEDFFRPAIRGAFAGENGAAFYVGADCAVAAANQRTLLTLDEQSILAALRTDWHKIGRDLLAQFLRSAAS